MLAVGPAGTGAGPQGSASGMRLLVALTTPPIDCEPYRRVAGPRIIGRLDAPGAKLDPVMPGFPNSMSPTVPPVLRRISSLGTTVTVANWSVTIGSVPGRA